MSKSGLKRRSLIRLSAIALSSDRQGLNQQLGIEEGEKIKRSFATFLIRNPIWYTATRVIVSSRRVFLINWSVAEIWFEDIVSTTLSESSLWETVMEMGFKHKVISIRYRGKNGEKVVKFYCVNSTYGKWKHVVHEDTEKLFQLIEKSVKKNPSPV